MVELVAAEVCPAEPTHHLETTTIIRRELALHEQL